MRKDQIEYHRLGYGSESVPAVNVKVYDWRAPRNLFLDAAVEYGYDRATAEDWYDQDSDTADSHGDAAMQGESLFEFACMDGWEQLQMVAEEVYGPGVTVYSEGRSSGWAYVDGIDHDTERWNAIAVSRWGRFAKYARAVADDTPYRMAVLVVLNQFESELSTFRREVVGAFAGSNGLGL